MYVTFFKPKRSCIILRQGVVVCGIGELSNVLTLRIEKPHL
jgi:hypothetical protein